MELKSICPSVRLCLCTFAHRSKLKRPAPAKGQSQILGSCQQQTTKNPPGTPIFVCILYRAPFDLRLPPAWKATDVLDFPQSKHTTHTHTRGGSKTIAKPPNFPLPGRTESSRSAKELNCAEINKQTKTRTYQRRTSPTAYPTGSASDWVSWEKHTKRNPPLCSIALLRGGFKTETLCGGSQQQSVSKSKGTHLRFACASGRCPGKWVTIVRN